ncbi:hypothetical protein [Candidatus Regiella insecticola]|nr:hypothetical protein [Candidatus Regiella insecticola]
MAKKEKKVISSLSKRKASLLCSFILPKKRSMALRVLYFSLSFGWIWL